jgi:aminopeptidase N
MTEATTALFVLAELGGAEAEAAFARFYDRWKHQPLVLDKWFSIQAGAPSPAALDRVRRLLDHPAYDRRSPNRVWALMGAFVFGNPEALHRPGHDGYDFLAREVMIMDRINPQLAARLIGHLAPWRRYDADRRSAMRRAIEWIASQDHLSRDVFEIVAKSLA